MRIREEMKILYALEQTVNSTKMAQFTDVTRGTQNLSLLRGAAY